MEHHTEMCILKIVLFYTKLSHVCTYVMTQIPSNTPLVTNKKKNYYRHYYNITWDYITNGIKLFEKLKSCIKILVGKVVSWVTDVLITDSTLGLLGF